MADEALFIKATDAPCEIHDWPTEGMPQRFVALMRERHGKGGVNVCRDCIKRSRDEAYRTMGSERT